MKRFAFAIIIALLSALLLLSSCGDKPIETPNSSSQAENVAPTQLGTGENSFRFVVIDDNSSRSEFLINTDESTVGNALKSIGMIDGVEGQYGLYVTVVNGIKAVYETDGKYWSFYIDDSLATAGVDSTLIEKGKIYTFKIENA